MKIRSLLGLFLLVLSSVSYATDLMDIYAQALENDPIFKKAYSTYQSTQEKIPQARSYLYPQVGLSGGVGRNYFFQSTSSALFRSRQYYEGAIWSVTTSQTVFNYQVWAALKQAKAEVKAAAATYHDAAQNLMLRTSAAYLEVLLAEDTLQLALAKKRSNLRQLEQADERFKVGLDTITSYYEAKSAFDQSTAEVILAEISRINKYESLRIITNHSYQALAPLRDNTIPLVKPEPAKVEAWINTGLKQNYGLLAARYKLESSRENMKSLTAGNWPVLALQGNASGVKNNIADTTNPVNPDAQSSANIGLALTFPVFDGGLVQSKTRQAQYDFQSSSEDLEQSLRNVVVNSRIAFNIIISGISKVVADKQTVVSTKNALESTEAQFQAGTRTMVDVVDAQQRLFQAQLDLATDQYVLINGILRLKYLAGTLTVTDLEQVNSWLKTTRVNGMVKTAMKS
jgi:outer membrane protein